MGTDLIADLVILATPLISVIAVVICLRGQRRDLTADLGKLRAEVRDDLSALRRDIKGELAGWCEEGARRGSELAEQIAGVRLEVRRVEGRLADRIDAVRSEPVETRVAMADRVARIEGRVFGLPLPDTGTDSA